MSVDRTVEQIRKHLEDYEEWRQPYMVEMPQGRSASDSLGLATRAESVQSSSQSGMP